MGEGQLDTTTYLPRPVVGSYLAALVEHATRKAAERGMRLEVIIDEVVDIAPPDTADGDYVVQTKSGRIVEIRYVYLALGHLDRAKTDAYQDHDRYHHQPYPITRLTREIPKEAAVGVIGTRLSAIDVVLGLVGEGHKGRSTASRAAVDCPPCGGTMGATSSCISNATNS